MRATSAINTDTPGRIDKPSVLQALKASGESYDRARETLKQVSVDASGKVELEDWVEVSLRGNDVTIDKPQMSPCLHQAQRQVANSSETISAPDQGRESHRSRLERQCQPYD
jgi:plastin-1